MNYLLMTKDNIDDVASRTRYTRDELIEVMEEWLRKGRREVRVPLPPAKGFKSQVIPL